MTLLVFTLGKEGCLTFPRHSWHCGERWAELGRASLPPTCWLCDLWQVTFSFLGFCWFLKWGSWIWFPSFLRALKSNEFYQEHWLGARLWNTTHSAELEGRIPVRLAPPEWQTLNSSHPHERGGQQLIPFVEMSKGLHPTTGSLLAAPSPPTHPAQRLLIKGSSSKKMGGSLRRGMNQQAQREKEEDPWGCWTFF